MQNYNDRQINRACLKSTKPEKLNAIVIPHIHQQQEKQTDEAYKS